jgi:hypothetical protein
MLELLGSLYVGIAEDVQKSKLPWIEQYCKAFLKKPEYSREHLDLLFYVLRNPTVHLSTGSGVRIMPWGPHEGKRITFHIDEQPGNPAIELVSESAAIPMWSKYWSCPYDYKLKVYLPSLKEDICKSVNGAGGYREKLMKSDDLLGKFERCMRHIYREPTSEATEKS